jgi:predicted secreted protein
MDPVGAIVVFVITWWLSFFCVLPIGVQGQFEDDGNVIEGTEEGAPKDPMLKKKALWATIGAVVLTLIAHFLVVPWLAAS